LLSSVPEENAPVDAASFEREADRNADDHIHNLHQKPQFLAVHLTKSTTAMAFSMSTKNTTTSKTNKIL
jgi:hypothetical protein